jgi:ribosomal protein S18 acetylase RimI-like enzyme
VSQRPTTITRIDTSNALEFKAIRLAALQDSPTAFGSTYAKESLSSDDDWIKRACNLDGAKSVGFLAMESGKACGIVAAFLDDQNPQTAHVVSMWIAPTHRRLGTGRSLIEAVDVWARDRRVKSLRLTVTSVNDAAIKFYKRIGFSMTGNIKPYPNDAAIIEYEMLRSSS